LIDWLVIPTLRTMCGYTPLHTTSELTTISVYVLSRRLFANLWVVVRSAKTFPILAFRCLMILSLNQLTMNTRWCGKYALCRQLQRVPVCKLSLYPARLAMWRLRRLLGQLGRTELRSDLFLFF